MYNRVMSKLNKFANEHINLYIYGAGNYGKKTAEFLHELNYRIRAFVVTEKNDVEDKINDIPVVEVTDVVLIAGVSDGILLAMKPAFQEEVEENLVECKANVLPLSEEDLSVVSNWESLSYFSELARLHPARRFTKLKDYQNILIIRLDVIGDMIWTTPFIRELRREVPKARLTLVLRREVYDLMKACPYLDEIICYDLPGYEMASEDFPMLEHRARDFAAANLVEKNFDIVFLPRFLHFSDCFENLMLAAFCGAKTRVGRLDYEGMGRFGRVAASIYKPMFSLLSLEHEEKKHELHRILQMLAMCGARLQDTSMELWTNQTARENAAKWLGNYDGRWIALGLVGRDANRRWDAKYYAELICTLRERYGERIRFVLLGGQDARSHADFLHENHGCLDLVGKTKLDVAAAVMDHCSLYIGPNTGIMHMAVAMKVPVVEISIHLCSSSHESGTSPARTGAIGVPHIALQPERGADEKCEQAGYCIKMEPHCILQVEPLLVISAAEDLLKVIN